MTPRPFLLSLSFFRIAFASLLLAALGGCASMTPAECKNANWQDVGLRDGLAGEPLTALDARTKSCAEAGVQANAQAYLHGRNQGLQSYCRLDHAARLGLDGKSYHGVCAAGIDAEFRHRYGVGREVYRARSELRSLDSRRNSLEDKLEDAKGNDERKRLRDDLSDLDRSLRRARDRLRDAEWAYDRLR
ncbi:DUF2799 domain-containing protein [uncultured Ramlibacter sp.]|uniref:DUF2799 domain-containing protein n=1 Tax=uncultured Ramlibacter sp. TaxID=260755 RepID=UPI00261B5762|nr:DUF2799 domain-containing protein [uncultured Ramlibacter sp.]